MHKPPGHSAVDLQSTKRQFPALHGLSQSCSLCAPTAVTAKSQEIYTLQLRLLVMRRKSAEFRWSGGIGNQDTKHHSQKLRNLKKEGGFSPAPPPLCLSVETEFKFRSEEGPSLLLERLQLSQVSPQHQRSTGRCRRFGTLLTHDGKGRHLHRVLLRWQPPSSPPTRHP